MISRLSFMSEFLAPVIEFYFFEITYNKHKGLNNNYIYQIKHNI